ncbi:MAG: ATP-binding protein [Phormidesmis sp.]
MPLADSTSQRTPDYSGSSLTLALVACEALRESEARFQKAVVNAPLPILIYAEDGEILHLSEGWTRLTGYTADDIPTLADWTEKAYGSKKEQVLELINQLFELDRTIDDGEFVIRTKAGASRVWQFSSSPLGKMVDGRRLVMSMAADITDLKQTEAALAGKLTQQAIITDLGQQALQTDDLKALFALATDLVAKGLKVEYAKVLALSPQGDLLKLVAGVGWRAGLVGQMSIRNDPDSQASYMLHGQQPVVIANLQSETRFSGSPLLFEHDIVSGISSLLHCSESKPFGVVGAYTRQQRNFTQADVDFVQAIANILSSTIERCQFDQKIQQLNRELESRVAQRTAQLQAANEELKAFTYTVSHDLRAPLRAMQGFAQALLEDYAHLFDDIGREYAGRIVTAAAQMDGLILDLLEYSRMNRAYKQQSLSLDRLMAHARSIIAPTIQSRQAEIVIEAPLPDICGNHQMVVQVLTNLLSNGIKFVEPGIQPKLQISWEETDSKIRLWIADNGIGIASEHHARVFKVFERLHGIESYPGTGIGLAIVKRGMEKLGGDFGVVSTVGQGSRFWIDFVKASDCSAKPSK